jgi:hypothetical protein
MKLVAIALLLAASLGRPSFAKATAGRQESKKAEDLFKDALAQAKESKKKLFLTFGSPG